MGHSVRATRDFARPTRQKYTPVKDVNLDMHPDVTAVCLHCTKKDCVGTCTDMQLARAEVSRRMGKGRKGYGFSYRMYAYKGREWSAMELARAEKLVYSRLWKLLRDGVDVAEAVEQCRRTTSRRSDKPRADKPQHRTPKSARDRTCTGGKPPKIYDCNGRKMTLRQIAEESGLKISTLKYRLSQGMAPEEAMGKPVGKQGRRKKGKRNDQDEGEA